MISLRFSFGNFGIFGAFMAGALPKARAEACRVTRVSVVFKGVQHPYLWLRLFVLIS